MRTLLRSFWELVTGALRPSAANPGSEPRVAEPPATGDQKSVPDPGIESNAPPGSFPEQRDERGDT